MACDTEDTDSNAKICKFVETKWQEKFEGNNKLRSRKQNIT